MHDACFSGSHRLSMHHTSPSSVLFRRYAAIEILEAGASPHVTLPVIALGL
jgi:hypothetical protein